MKKGIPACISACLGLLMQLQLSAQPRYSAGLGEIKHAAFYKIPLSPEIVSRSVNDLGDIRILNGKRQQVPYILQRDDASAYSKSFIELPILSVGKGSDKLTHVVIQNATYVMLDQLVLEIKNSEAARVLTLSGSDDNRNWFVIKENIRLEGLHRQNDYRVFETIQFPYSSYGYFRISFEGENRIPLNIIRAGFYARVLKDGSYQSVPSAVLTQINSDDRNSYITAHFNNQYVINKIGIQAKGPRFYSRSMSVYNLSNGKKQLLGSYLLRSDDTVLYLVNARTRELLIEINNHDNPPLTVTAINAFQAYTYLVAWLEPDRYHLELGDTLATAPIYDLAAFSDSIGNGLFHLAPGPLRENERQTRERITSGYDKLILWSAIGMVLLVLLFVTLRLTRKVSSEKI